jgi:hypothetical protein
MSDDFLESLLFAVAEFMGVAVEASNASPLLGTSPSNWQPSLSRLADKPVTLDVPHNRGIAGIRDADPAFELDAFLVHVGQMFAAYHSALDHGDLKPARRFIDEMAWAQLEQAAQKTGRRLEGPQALKIRAIRPMTALHENGLDVVRVFITAEQPGTDELLCEYWELMRKQGALTQPGLDLTHCPNCGAPITGDDPTRCAYCNERFADPAFDWVVSKITVQ